MKSLAATPSPSRRFAAVTGLVGCLLGAAPFLRATQTENLGFRVLPSPGAMAIDGRATDWDLSGGLFICDNVEEQRDRHAVWVHAQYDREHLYLLARFSDPTPLNNPGQIAGSHGFEGDSLQFRVLLDAGTPRERTLHFTAWRDRDGADIVKVEQGKDLKGPVIADAKTAGVRQAFRTDPTRPGYDHELAIPWALLTSDHRALGAGDRFALTFEPNFFLGSRSRLSIKDLFQPGVTIDRIFTFTNFRCWGPATLVAGGAVTPQPVRLADGTEIPVAMKDGVPTPDWSKLPSTPQVSGVVEIPFTLPFDGVVSLQVLDAQSNVVSQVLNGAALAKGPQVAQWDGLTTKSWTRPGEPVPAGEYSWRALAHRGLGLKLRGWAANSGSAPWDGATGTENWGGDHGNPSAVATDDQRVYLGWSGAEAGKSLLACDPDGRVLWNHKRGGIGGVKDLASTGETLLVLGGAAGDASRGGNLYRLDAATGGYRVWSGSGQVDLAVAQLWPADAPSKPARADAVAWEAGAIVLEFQAERLRAFLDPASGTLLRTEPLTTVGSPSAVRGVLRCVLNRATQQIYVFESGDRPARSLGQAGGRAATGPWQADAFRDVADMAIDARGQLWVVESGSAPKRISVWDPRRGRLVRELFGPSSYGALGGAIHPGDPDLMIGQGCEWRLDPTTGQARCLGVITRDGMENARFATGTNGRVYLAVASHWAFTSGPIRIYERVGAGDYRLRTEIAPLTEKGEPVLPESTGVQATRTAVWSDANGDGQRQPDETTVAPGHWRFSRWFMNFGPDLSLFAESSLFPVAGFTAAGAPRYDLSKPVRLPASGFVSADRRFLLQGGNNNVVHSAYTGYDLATGRRRWSYPDNFTGVHGSHTAPPPAAGLIRGSFGPCGSATLPPPIGNVWAIPSNVGEWHLLNEDGFYLGRLFEPDPLQVRWPERAVPGADLTRVPPGSGGEDFGGSLTLDRSGRLLVQAGKTAFWNVEATGLDTAVALPGKRFTLSADQVAAATRLREQALQATTGARQLAAKFATPKFTGNLGKDFAGAELVTFEKGAGTRVRSAVAWDDTHLHLGWQVTDATPWTNGADIAEALYTGGDTVDFQLGTDPKTDPKRATAAAGDLRLSIGPLAGQPTAVLYRPVATGEGRTPKTFSSGVVDRYQVDDVRILAAAQVKVFRQKDAYTVEASIPWSELGGRPADGATLIGDLGATFGDAAGRRTRLRSHWNNQQTGLVDDAVIELQLVPRNWGRITFRR